MYLSAPGYMDEIDGGQCFARQHGGRNKNVWRFFKLSTAVNFWIYWYIDMKLAETFQNGVIYIL